MNSDKSLNAVDSPPKPVKPHPLSPGWRHALPFVVWIAIMMLPGDPSGWRYAIRAALGAGVFLWCRPWEYYKPPRWSDALVGVPVGIAVLLVWIGLETPWAERFPAVQEFYLRWFVLPVARLPESPATSPYAPSVCGWPLSLVRLAGSAFVIAVVEEFFWRGFLYRWLVDRNFLSVKLELFELQAFLLMVLFFGLEHDRWLAGMFAGAAYGGVILWRRNVWAAVFAHVLTNFLLGLWVLHANQYIFW